ncbi:leucyl aminopeptidase [Candidatus Woesearchaeota archaeon]|nr:leucyl aminopeptidase [Candidatus Woesearchaeota archaeon]
MNLKLHKGEVKNINTNVLSLGLFEHEKNNPFLQQCGKEINAEVQTAIKNKEFSADFGEIKTITPLGKVAARRLFIVGLGKRSEFNLEKLRRISANILKAAKNAGAKHYTSVLHHAGTFPKDQAAFAAAEGVLLADYGFNRYITEEKEKLKSIDSVVFLERDVSPQLQKAVEKAVMISSITNYVRDLVNLPANVVNPEYLAEEALKLKKYMKVTVFDMTQLKKMGCGGIVAVGQGSANEPKLIVLDYNPHAKKSLAIVGKGVTFDSGGLSLKPGKYMETMKQDMAGGAVVLGVLKAAAEMKLNVHLMGVIPTVENMPGGKSYRPDDIITFFNGKTAEIGNTDAEGRVILADGLSYAESLKPQRIIDLATLTGACVVALGYWATG